MTQMIKTSASNAGDPGSIPESGRSPGEGNGNALQYSCLENSMDGGAWQATVHGAAKSETQLSNFTFIIGYWNSKVGSQEIPRVTGKFQLGVQKGRAKASRVLPRECTGHDKHPLPTTQEKILHMDITWSIAKSD